jgi:hypothetical protein
LLGLFVGCLQARLVEPTFQQLALADDDGTLLTSFTPQPFAVKWQSTWPFHFFPRDACLLVPPSLDFVCVHVSASASYRRMVRHVTSLPPGALPSPSPNQPLFS